MSARVPAAASLRYLDLAVRKHRVWSIVPTHTFTHAGDYPVEVTAAGLGAATSRQRFTVSVSGEVSTQFEAGASSGRNSGPPPEFARIAPPNCPKPLAHCSLMGDQEGGGMSGVDFEIWLNHFEYHALHPRCVPQGLSDLLRPDERRLIAGSIATFQLGEKSEGRTLLQAAQRFADAHRVPALVRITELIIREERHHAALLLAYMADHHIPPKRSEWTDGVFRRVRRLAGLELYLSVLISAELIGIVYYRALAAATDCPRLTVLCRSLVSDELAHVGFESQLLLVLRAGRAAPRRLLARFSHGAFFAGTAVVVWFTHRAVLRQGGHGAQSFLRSCLSQYAFYLEPVKATPASHAAPRVADRTPSPILRCRGARPP